MAGLDVGRWHTAAAGEDHWLLDRCRGATIDLGCGPGRVVEALTRRGMPALGVDLAEEAVAACRRRGADGVRADVLGPLPGAGGWDTVLLADGDVGIGGDPVRLLGRARLLLRGGGTILVELDPGDDGVWRGHARVRCHDRIGRPSRGRPRAATPCPCWLVGPGCAWARSIGVGAASPSWPDPVDPR